MRTHQLKPRRQNEARLVVACDSCDTVVDLDLRVKPRDPEASIRVVLRDAQCPRCNGHGRPRASLRWRGMCRFEGSPIEEDDEAANLSDNRCAGVDASCACHPRPFRETGSSNCQTSSCRSSNRRSANRGSSSCEAAAPASFRAAKTQTRLLLSSWRFKGRSLRHN